MLQDFKKIVGVVCRGTLIGLALVASSVLQADSRDVNLIRQESQQFASGNKVAVVVGVNNYSRGSGLKTLKYAVSDANIIRNVLQNRHGYTVRHLPNADGNKDNILAAIANAGALLRNKQGTLVFYFSGHGFSDSGKNYLAPSNFNMSRVTQSGLTISEVEAAIKKTGARRAILFIDACRDDPGIDGSKGVGRSAFREQHSSGVQHLFGAEFGKQSWEHASLRHGVFSYYLYRGLDGAAREQDGVISFDSLKSYVQENVLQWSFKHLPVPQKPYHAGEAYGVFVLGQIGRPVIQPTATKKSFEPDMVDIPAGRFNMGCDPARDNVAGGCFDSEKPVHTVNIRGFKMAKTEVTFDQWDACTAAGVCVKANDQGWGRGQRPVINVSWNEIQIYMKWLNQQTGKRYQLPTEAQWEYSARANRNTAFPWGNSISCTNANFGSYSKECKTDRTKPVGSYPANVFGLHDTSGNVWEWVADCWGSYQGASATGEVQQDCASSQGNRVLRGGSWSFSGSRSCRSAFRGGFRADGRDQGIGFRLSLGL